METTNTLSPSNKENYFYDIHVYNYQDLEKIIQLKEYDNKIQIIEYKVNKSNIGDNLLIKLKLQNFGHENLQNISLKMNFEDYFLRKQVKIEKIDAYQYCELNVTLSVNGSNFLKLQSSVNLSFYDHLQREIPCNNPTIYMKSGSLFY